MKYIPALVQVSLHNVLDAFKTAGWLMLGTGGLAWMFQPDGIEVNWAFGATVVGLAFVLGSGLLRRLFRVRAAQTEKP
jgi:uncharacterized membrane protein